MNERDRYSAIMIEITSGAYQSSLGTLRSRFSLSPWHERFHWKVQWLAERNDAHGREVVEGVGGHGGAPPPGARGPPPPRAPAACSGRCSSMDCGSSGWEREQVDGGSGGELGRGITSEQRRRTAWLWTASSGGGLKASCSSSRAVSNDVPVRVTDRGRRQRFYRGGSLVPVRATDRD